MRGPVRLYWLDPRDPSQPFPDARNALDEPNGLLAIGGDLSVTRLVRAYTQGVFPWYNPDEPILWWSPDPRTVFPMTGRLPRTVRRAATRPGYHLTLDTAFDAVVDACAAPRDQQRGTWLGPDMRAAYRKLFDAGYAHSLEVWQQNTLVGGLYGLALGRAFFGESMFSRVSGGSKTAVYWLREQLLAWDFAVFDCQVGSDHLDLLGAVSLPRTRFLTDLHLAVAQGHRPGPWTLDLPHAPIRTP